MSLRRYPHIISSDHIVVAMNHIIACIYNFSCRGNFDVRREFKKSVHCFAYNGDIAFHRTAQAYVGKDKCRKRIGRVSKNESISKNGISDIFESFVYRSGPYQVAGFVDFSAEESVFNRFIYDHIDFAAYDSFLFRG